MRKAAILTIFILFTFVVAAQELPYKKGKLIYKDNFERTLKNWVIESPVAHNPKIEIVDGKLSMQVTGGATVWFKKKLNGNYLIEFKRKVIIAGGERDRLSDLNMFWAATDPLNANLFTRTGVLEEYDSVKMYYVGMGGNTNSTTRFRKYEGNGERTLLKEYLDKEHLLEANKEYLIQIAVINGATELYIDGEKFFSYVDPIPLTEGYFGIRTTKSHHEADDFRVYKLK